MNAFSSPEAALLLVSTKNRQLWGSGDENDMNPMNAQSSYMKRVLILVTADIYGAWFVASFVGLVLVLFTCIYLGCDVTSETYIFRFLIMSTTLVQEKSLVGTIDIVLLASFIGVLLYWFCGRKKKTETAALTQKLVLA